MNIHPLPPLLFKIKSTLTMKKYSIFLLIYGCVLFVNGQSPLQGAWKWEGTDSSGNAITSISILTAEGFQSTCTFSSGQFISTNGGMWQLKGTTLQKTVEFDTQDKSNIGKSLSFEVRIKQDELRFEESGQVWQRIDSGQPGALKGAWLITGRMRDGEIRESVPGARKTMKILSGTRFQWIAYNTETGEFFGTGGGTYTTLNGTYTEIIDVFSRDSSRIGITLNFDYEIKEGKWHHSGKSSKGDPIYEVWSLRTR